MGEAWWVKLNVKTHGEKGERKEKGVIFWSGKFA
jgi:hypothetical protein